MSVQLALFDLEGLTEKAALSVEALYGEFQSLGIHQRNNAGYGGDVKAERLVRSLISEGDNSYMQWRNKRMTDAECRDKLYEHIVRLWCVKVNGKVCRNIYGNPQPPVTYKPVFDDSIAARIPPELMKLIPKQDVLLVYFETYESGKQTVYHVVYRNEGAGFGNWHDATILFDHQKGKWSEGRTAKIFGASLRTRDYHWWTRDGFEKAKAEDKMDPQIAAVWSNYVKFYGRNEALCRLGLPPLSLVEDVRSVEEVEKLAWYAK